MYIVFAIIGVILLLFLGKILKLSVKVLSKLIANSISGLILIIIFNLFGSVLGLKLEMTPINALISGFFGLPGVILLLLI